MPPTLPPPYSQVMDPPLSRRSLFPDSVVVTQKSCTPTSVDTISSPGNSASMVTGNNGLSVGTGAAGGEASGAGEAGYERECGVGRDISPPHAASGHH